MFLSNNLDEPEWLHELDFRFEYDSQENTFLLIHHGVTLFELLHVCGRRLGEKFHLIQMSQPVSLSEFAEHFKIASPTFDYVGLESFYKEVNTTRLLDCAILGTSGEEASEHDVENVVKNHELYDFRSLVHTHDNHFLWVKARGLDLLRDIIQATLIGFFSLMHAYPYKPIPDAFVDLIIRKYHTVPLVCSNDSGVQVGTDQVQVLIETCESPWTSSRMSFPKELLGRGLLISYDLKGDAWTFEEWHYSG